MRSIILTITAICIVYVIAGEDAAYKNLKHRCMEKAGVTRHAVAQSKKGDFSYPNLGAYYDCVMIEAGYLDSNHHFNMPRLLEKIKKLYGEEKAKIIERFCLNEIGSGSLIALNFAKCFTAYGGYQ